MRSAAKGSSSGRMRCLSAGEIFALERQFLRDRDRPESELRKRDREIGRALLRIGGEAVADRRALYRGWLRSLGGEAAGDAARLERAVAIAGIGVLVSGALTGAGTAAGLLRYDGSTPINLLHFVGVFVVLQGLLLVAWIVALAAWRGSWRSPGAVAALLGGMVRSALRHGLSGDRHDALRADLDWLRRIGGWYSGIERWSLARLGQLFGVSFNAGALAITALLMATSDLAFAWRSTIDWRPEQIHALLTAMSAPWGWAVPVAVPTLELVGASHHFRGAGAPALSPELMARWWSFLLLSLICYGLVPRGLAWWVAELRLRRALRGIDLDRGDLADLHDRLTLPLVETPGTDLPGDPELDEAAAMASEPVEKGSAWGIVWRDAPIDDARAEELAASRLGWGLDGCVTAGGGTDASIDHDSLETLRSLPLGTRLLLLAEAFDPPTKELLHFLSALSDHDERPADLVVFLVAPNPGGGWEPAGDEEIALWRSCLACLRNPRLRVVTLLEGGGS